MSLQTRRRLLGALLAWVVAAPVSAQRYGRRRGRTNRDKNQERERQRRQENRVYGRYLDLLKEGHNRRHHFNVTDEQLQDRVLRRIDPLTGTTTDAVTKRKHKQTYAASRFDSPLAMVRADNWLRGSSDFARRARAELDAAARNNRSPKAVSIELPLRDALGPEHATLVSGFGLERGRLIPLDYHEGLVKGVFTFENGRWITDTIYPIPLSPPKP